VTIFVWAYCHNPSNETPTNNVRQLKACLSSIHQHFLLRLYLNSASFFSNWEWKTFVILCRWAIKRLVCLCLPTQSERKAPLISLRMNTLLFYYIMSGTLGGEGWWCQHGGGRGIVTLRTNRLFRFYTFIH